MFAFEFVEYHGFESQDLYIALWALGAQVSICAPGGHPLNGIPILGLAYQGKRDPEHFFHIPDVPFWNCLPAIGLDFIWFYGIDVGKNSNTYKVGSYQFLSGVSNHYE